MYEKAHFKSGILHKFFKYIKELRHPVLFVTGFKDGTCCLASLKIWKIRCVVRVAVRAGWCVYSANFTPRIQPLWALYALKGFQRSSILALYEVRQKRFCLGVYQRYSVITVGLELEFKGRQHQLSVVVPYCVQHQLVVPTCLHIRKLQCSTFIPAPFTPPQAKQQWVIGCTFFSARLVKIITLLRFHLGSNCTVDFSWLGGCFCKIWTHRGVCAALEKVAGYPLWGITSNRGHMQLRLVDAIAGMVHLHLRNDEILIRVVLDFLGCRAVYLLMMDLSVQRKNICNSKTNSRCLPSLSSHCAFQPWLKQRLDIPVRQHFPVPFRSNCDERMILPVFVALSLSFHPSHSCTCSLPIW